MILTVTLNVALDVTYQVDALVPGAAHRVRTVVERPGGKGLNVARVLHALGEPVIATGLIGGAAGVRARDLLETKHAFVEIAGESRRTVVVSDGSDATGFWEPGPLVTAEEWAEFVARYRGLVAVARVVVLSGSLPRGVPVDAYAELVTIARERGVPTILDTSGEPLTRALAAGPDVIKPNAEELSEAIRGTALAAGAVTAQAGAETAAQAGAETAQVGAGGLPRHGAEAGAAAHGVSSPASNTARGNNPGTDGSGTGPADGAHAGVPATDGPGADGGARTTTTGPGPTAGNHAVHGDPDRDRPTQADGDGDRIATAGLAHIVECAEALRKAGARAVLASRGPDGMLAVTADGRWLAAPPAPVAGNPTGAGDSAVAAVARGLAYQKEWSSILTDAVALSASAVLAPEAGAFDSIAYRAFRRAVTPQEL
ncbi:PfkB family carbohydrate kinase [Longispora sp. K20-0274]|uniref:1-phosphofructokinase family hexose kinase n=1 Tax=Longispora sp. K20-0274 TaxID=3088255 RepID=UPI00399A4784